MDPNNVKAPVHLWIVAVLAILWNAVGAFDYVATHYNLEFYMSQFSAEQLEYFQSFPAWEVAAWAIAVWGALLASFGLLLRKAWAAWMFGLSILGLAVSSLYTLVLTNGREIMGSEGTIFTAVIWVIALFLFFYARAMAKRGVLR
jgi:hypothetical protein